MKRKRLLATVFCAMLLITLLPQAAYAADEGAIQLGADGIKASDKVYFGKYTKYTKSATDYDVPWIALNDNGFLLSQYTIGSVRFRDCRHHYESPGPQNPGYYGDDWNYNVEDSQLKLTMDGLYNGEDTKLFTVPEQGAVAATELTAKSMDYDGEVRPLTVHLYPLSIMEIYDYSASKYVIDEALLVTGDISDKLNGNEYGWWTRTNDSDTHVVRVGGKDTASPRTDDIQESLAIRGVRPAFNLDASKVLFISAAVGGKTGDASLAAVGANASGEWKLTLKDTDRDAFSITTIALSSISATVNYSGAQTGANEYISAMIVDNDSVAYYGRIKNLSNTADASGTVTVNIPSGVTLDADTTLRVFNEQFNGNRITGDDTSRAYTDYASELLTVTAPPTPPTPKDEPAAPMLPLEIAEQPKAQKVAPGESAIFTVTPKGNAPFKYEWQIDKQDGLGFVPIDGANSNSYTLSSATAEQNGWILRCKIIDSLWRFVYSEEIPLGVAAETAHVEPPQTGDAQTMAGVVMLGIALLAAAISITKRFAG